MKQREPAHHQRVIRGERLKKKRPGGKCVQKYVVAIIEITQKLGDRGARLRQLRMHTARSIDVDSDRDRSVQILAEKLDRPLLPIHEEFEILLRQIRYVAAALIGHRDR